MERIYNKPSKLLFWLSFGSLVTALLIILLGFFGIGTRSDIDILIYREYRLFSTIYYQWAVFGLFSLVPTIVINLGTLSSNKDYNKESLLVNLIFYLITPITLFVFLYETTKIYNLTFVGVIVVIMIVVIILLSLFSFGYSLMLLINLFKGNKEEKESKESIHILTGLKQLKDEGLITEDEFLDKKNKYLEKL